MYYVFLELGFSKINAFHHVKILLPSFREVI